MDWMMLDDLTDLRRRELEESKRAWQRFKTKKDHIDDPEPPEIEIMMGGMEPGKKGKPSAPPKSKLKGETPNISLNIGIPEKKRGWELADIQYHGGTFHSGEW